MYYLVNETYFCCVTVNDNLFQEVKSESSEINCSSRLTSYESRLWSELQLHSVLLCLPGVRQSVICLLVSYLITQQEKMQALGHVENWKIGFLLVNFPSNINPVIKINLCWMLSNLYLCNQTEAGISTKIWKKWPAVWFWGMPC